MLSAAALRMGEVAAVNATGGDVSMPGAALPHLLHTLPEIGWIGFTQEQAARAGYDVCTGTVDLGYNARALALGAPFGLVKLVAERNLGEILGVHAVGPGAGEIIAAAATAMHAELTLDGLASVLHWHPGLAESLS